MPLASGFPSNPTPPGNSRDNSGLCLDVYGAGSNQGQQFDQWPCKDALGTNQDFKA